MWPLSGMRHIPDHESAPQRSARRASELAGLLPSAPLDDSHVVLGAAIDSDAAGPWGAMLMDAPLLRAVPQGHLLTLGCGETRKLDLAMTAFTTWRGPLLFVRGGDLRPADVAAVRWRREVLGREVFVIGQGHGSLDALGWLDLVPVSGRNEAARLAAETLIMQQPYDDLSNGALEAARNAAADALVGLWRLFGRRPRFSQWLAALDGDDPLLCRAREMPLEAITMLDGSEDGRGREVIEEVAAGRADALVLSSYAASWSAPACLRMATLALTAPFLAAGSRGMLIMMHRLEWLLPWSWTDEVLMNVRAITMWGVSENMGLDRLGAWPDRVWAMQYAGARGTSPYTQRLLRAVEGCDDGPQRMHEARIACMPRRLQVLTLKGHEGGFLGVKAPWWAIPGTAAALAGTTEEIERLVPFGSGPLRADIRDAASWQWPSRVASNRAAALAAWQRRAQELLPRLVS